MVATPGCLRTVFNVHLTHQVKRSAVWGITKNKIRSKIGDCNLQATTVEAKITRIQAAPVETKHDQRKAGRPPFTYVDLKQDTGLEEPDIKAAMLTRSVRRAITVRDMSQLN